MKHLEVRQKYSATRRIFNSLLGVSSGDETLRLMFDILLEKPKNYYQHRFVFEVFRGSIPRFFEVDHINNDKSDNRIKNLQLLLHKQNVGKSKNKPIISTNIKTGEERKFISIQEASIKLNIHCSFISNICCKRKSYKSATSKKTGMKYTFKFID